MVRHTADAAPTPGALLARTLVRLFGPALLHGGRSGLIGAATAGLLAILGLGACWFGWPTFGFVLAALAWGLQRATAMVERLRREVLALPGGGSWRANAMQAAFDLNLVAMLLVAIPPLSGEVLVQRAFAPVMLLGLLRFLGGSLRASWASWCEDRLALCLLLAGMARGAVLDIGVPAFCILLLVSGLLLAREPSPGSGLTRA